MVSPPQMANASPIAIAIGIVIDETHVNCLNDNSAGRFNHF